MIVDGNRLNWSSEYFIVTTYNTSTTKTSLSNMKIHLMKCVWVVTTCLYYISFKIKICLDFDTNMSRVNDILTDDILQSFGLKCCKYEALKSEISHWEYNISFTRSTACDIISKNIFMFVLDFKILRPWLPLSSRDKGSWSETKSHLISIPKKSNLTPR